MEIEVRSPFPPYAWPLVWEWMQSFRSRVMDDFSPRTREAFVEQMMARTSGHLTLGVWRGDELGGMIWFEQASPVSGAMHVVFARGFRGAESTDAALGAAAAQIFGRGISKITALCFADNHALRSAFVHFGMKPEGVLRRQTLRQGRPLDVHIWGLLKGEFDARCGESRDAG